MSASSLSRDIAAVSNISAVPTILKVVAELTGMRCTFVARVTADSWTACAVYDHLEFGLQIGDQLDVATTLCKEVCDTRRTIFIEHASLDPVYRTHHTPKLYNIESYIAVPIRRPNGQMFGTLCAIDRRPAHLEPKVIESLTLFTEIIARQLHDEEAHQEIERALWDERKVSQLREQFIAVLGHDLRTPLGGIAFSAEALLEELPAEARREIVRGLQESCTQMSRLIDDVLDFARGRLGDGITVTSRLVPDVRTLIRMSVMELERANPSRTIVMDMPRPLPGVVDDVRLRQVFSNLLSNALQHGPADELVRVKADQTAGLLRVAITNGGPALPADTLKRIFEPFHRRKTDHPRPGLGLGLYIAAQISRAHGGTLTAESNEKGTTFTVILPASPRPLS